MNDSDAGHIDVDLDGTLAKYDGWKGIYHIGEPVPKMLDRVKKWISDGKQVHILTARVASNNPNHEKAKGVIESWLKKHVGKVLPVTAEKDSGTIRIWDDRAIQVKTNTGERVDGDSEED